MLRYKIVFPPACGYVYVCGCVFYEGFVPSCLATKMNGRHVVERLWHTESCFYDGRIFVIRLVLTIALKALLPTLCCDLPGFCVVGSAGMNRTQIGIELVLPT